MRRSLSFLLLLWVLPRFLSAQTLAQRVSAVADGSVRLSFAARAGICGQWSDGVSMRHDSDEWRADCGPRLVRVALRLRNHQVQSVRTYVGGQWIPDRRSTDLGIVRPHEAADYFIGLAERSTSIAGDPLLPSVLADSVTIWHSLLRVARTPRAPQETRSKAVFWLSQAAGAAAGKALNSIAHDDRGDREVEEILRQ